MQKKKKKERKEKKKLMLTKTWESRMCSVPMGNKPIVNATDSLHLIATTLVLQKQS